MNRNYLPVKPVTLNQDHPGTQISDVAAEATTKDSARRFLWAFIGSAAISTIAFAGVVLSLIFGSWVSVAGAALFAAGTLVLSVAISDRAIGDVTRPRGVDQRWRGSAIEAELGGRRLGGHKRRHETS